MADFISFEEAKQELGLSDKDLHSFIAQGKLSPKRQDGVVQFPADEINALKEEQNDSILLDIDEEAIVLDFADDEIILEMPDDEPIVIDEPEIIIEEPEETVILEEPTISLDEPETISLEEPEKIHLEDSSSDTVIILDDEEEDSNSDTIVLIDEDETSETQTIVLNDDAESDTILLADEDDDNAATETISLTDDTNAATTQSDLTIAMSEEEMVAENDDDLAMELAGGGQVSAIPEGAYVVTDMPPSMIVTIPLILSFVILIFGGMILYPMVSNASPEVGDPFVPSYLVSLLDTVRNW